MKTTVIHHSADFDGLFCREIARKFLPDAELIGWDYGNPKIPVPLEGVVYILDLSPECLDAPYGELLPSILERIIWVDHHASAIAKYPASIPGYRIDGVAACRLAWQWFAGNHHDPNGEHYGLPKKQDFIDRKTARLGFGVNEPLAVRLAGEYDIWDKRDPNAELFQHGLRSRDLTQDWPSLLSLNAKLSVSQIETLIDAGHQGLCRPDGTNPNPTVLSLLESGRCLQYVQAEQNASIIKHIGFDLEWEGLKFLACNHARYSSHLFTAGLRPDHDACFGFKWTGKDWSVSLYHAPGKEQHDLSLIAGKHGGGGHRGACGFIAKTLPFTHDHAPQTH